jgi:peptide/histidine transporter 3/4
MHLLDKAKTSNGGSYSHLQVEGVKLVTRLTPFLLVMIPFWGIYNQTSTAFQNQGCQMNLLIGALEIPVSALNIFDNISILLLVPIFDGYVYPKLKEKGYPLTMLVKMGTRPCFLLFVSLALFHLQVGDLLLLFLQW